jgi:hypothetical protein
MRKQLLLGCVVVFLSCLAGGVSAQVPKNLDEKLIHQRGIEAILWSMPAISDVFFRESLFRDYGMKPGDVLVMSKPLVARHD